MANRNFVVQNGLTVGPLTIDASTGDIATSGNLSFSGGGGLQVTQISRNDSSISINDTGTGSTVVIAVDGSTRANVNTIGMNVSGILSINGATGATVDDATALSIALGG